MPLVESVPTTPPNTREIAFGELRDALDLVSSEPEIETLFQGSSPAPGELGQHFLATSNLFE
jgi:hypothetical protein